MCFCQESFFLKFVLAVNCLSSVSVSATKYTAISIVGDLPASSGLYRALGRVRKYNGGNSPLFAQDRPWEPRIDNGYPNIIPPVARDADVLTEADRSFQLFYGDCGYGCDRQLLLYANSSDGIAWQKPELGIFNLDTANMPKYKGLGTKNNIIVEGGGIGVFRDLHEKDPAKRYKGIGQACWESPELANCGCLQTDSEDVAGGLSTKERRFVGQSAASADGLRWDRSSVRNVSWPPSQKWDTHNNAFWDEKSQRYLVTTRNLYSPNCAREGSPQGYCRNVATDMSTSADAFVFDTSKTPALVEQGTVEHQLYAQITFPWHNTYLGLVMVFDASTGDQVHCRLVWSNTPHEALEASGRSAWQWVEQDASGQSAGDFIPLGTDGHFDSHVIFAAASPFTWPPVTSNGEQEERIYYMGGNGPHGGERNSSFGLATVRKDGYASLSGTGTIVTMNVLCTGPQLVVTVDFEEGKSGSLRIGLDRHKGLPNLISVEHSVPLTSQPQGAASSYTDQLMRFDNGHDFSNATDGVSYIGHNITLVLELSACSLFTIGFATPQLDTTHEQVAFI